jgi:DNA-binding transcriptional regulator YiaG
LANDLLQSASTLRKASLMTPIQCRLARTLLDIKRADWAKLSGVSEKAIANFETGRTTLIRANYEVLRKTLERMGVEFTDGDGVKRRQD